MKKPARMNAPALKTPSQEKRSHASSASATITTDVRSKARAAGDPDAVSRHAQAQQTLAAHMPFNSQTKAEYGYDAAVRPATGVTTLLEDFILREKITYFDHERIPARVVHARGSGAHDFEAYQSLTRLTRAAPFTEAGKITPVFVRFSTVSGERGSADTARDVRGFAVKFYSDEGNWDLVGNNMPVFFIQDAMKFPDLVHAVKPEPHHGMPQATSAVRRPSLSARQ